ncbi:MAG: pilus (MSHA type) biogenesis protein MshL [Gammaproteobacteria bacterium CG22_combo_CG10-13_8_21_14_all_40_8]|nr:MAG: pilus (MSHA type) biogenesis protein MshL [Gammaproteobacteria bacterium CG22_combo_CG10-13_8_21_14_all_40_8]
MILVNVVQIMKKRSSRRILQTLLLLGLSGLMMSCQSLNENKDTLDYDKALSAEQSTKTMPVSDEQIMEELLPPATANIQPQPEPSFDVKVNNVDVDKFFMGLIQGTSYNLVLAPGVKGKITLDLRGVTVPQVMKLVRDVYGYDYRFDQGVYTVLPATMRTEIFTLDYINLKRAGTSQTIVNSGQVSGSGNAGGGSANNGQTTNGSTSGSSATSQSNSTSIDTQTDADVWKEVQETVSLLVSDNKDARVKVSPQIGLVIVRAEPYALRMVAQYLNSSSNNLSRQVLLEAKILEVNLNKGHQSGVNWQSFGKVNSNNVLNLSQTGQQVQSGSSSNPLQGVFSLVYQQSDFNAVIELLNTQGDVQVLSSPRVSTMNNQKAVIKVGSDEFFVTDVSTTTIAGSATSTVTPDVTLTPFFSGIALDVTPQISANGDVILHVHPTVSDVVDQTKVIDLGDSNFTLPLALSSVRESDSIVRAKSGQVIVIGGLMQEKIINNENKTPIVGDIPIAGNLFKQSKTSRVKSELVILLKTQVIDNDSWQQDISATRQRVQDNLGH